MMLAYFSWKYLEEAAIIHDYLYSRNMPGRAQQADELFFELMTACDTAG